MLPPSAPAPHRHRTRPVHLPPLIEGRLLRRYKRFLADVALPDGRVVTAHTPNTGRMEGLTRPGSRVWLRDSHNPRRKYRYSWVLVEARPGVLVGIDTALSNRLVREGIENGTIAALQGYRGIRQEVPYGRERSRIDLLLTDGPGGQCFVEVKNVTLVENGIAYFPDAITERGRKHLRELAHQVQRGHRGVVFFCVQRGDARRFHPADHIDPRYGETLREVIAQGVETLAYRARVSVEEISLDQPLAVEV